MKQRYGRLAVVRLSHRDVRHRKFYVCRCDCGTEKVVQAHLLSCGNTRSCGCLSKEAKARQRLPNNHGEITAIILGYKRHAQGRGYQWMLTRPEVMTLISRDCHYCGAAPTNQKVTKSSLSPFAYNGIDRTDNSKGYVLENVVACCRICNRAKQTLTLREFADWGRRLAAMADQWGALLNRERVA